jgi:hypothetical protein
MTTPKIPREYAGTRYTRERYTEGWHDARSGRPHAHAGHAEEIIRQQGRQQYDAYSAGHAAGREAAQAEPAIMAHATALLDELEQIDLALLPIGQVAELAARLRRATETLEAHQRGRESTP